MCENPNVSVKGKFQRNEANLKQSWMSHRENKTFKRETSSAWFWLEGFQGGKTCLKVKWNFDKNDWKFTLECFLEFS